LINAAYAGKIKTMSPFNKVVSINLKNAFSGDPLELDHTKVVLCDIEGSTVTTVVLTAQPNQVMEITWEPNSDDPNEQSLLLTFILINTRTNKVIIYPDAEARNAGSASITAPADWVNAPTALHVVTYDYSQMKSGEPQWIIQFKAGCDPTSTVQ